MAERAEVEAETSAVGGPAEEIDHSKMSTREIRAALRKLGVPTKEFKQLSRAEMILMLNEKWHQGAGDGEKGGIIWPRGLARLGG